MQWKVAATSTTSCNVAIMKWIDDKFDMIDFFVLVIGIAAIIYFS